MKLTPLDIKKQEFKRSVRGLDPLEVETFLDMVADQYESLIRERNDLTDEVLKLKTQLRDYQEVEKTLRETLMHAQQDIKDSRENSKREAELLIRDGELQAEKILEEAKLKLAEMKNELVVIKAQKESFARRLRHLLLSQLDLIEVLELDDLGFEKQEGKRLRRSRMSRRNEHQIELDGLDEEVEPGQSRPRSSNENEEQSSTIQEADSSLEPIWESNQPNQDQDNEQNKKEEDSSQGSRISDKLIF